MINRRLLLKSGLTGTGRTGCHYESAYRQYCGVKDHQFIPPGQQNGRKIHQFAEHGQESGNPFTKSQFEGCLLGAVVGDCHGFKFQETVKGKLVSTHLVQNYFDQVVGRKLDDAESVDILPFTSDLSITASLAEFLVHHNLEVRSTIRGSGSYFVMADVAERWRKAYCSSQDRHHVPHLVSITEWADPGEASVVETENEGAVESGAAVRIAPLALMGAQPFNLDEVIKGHHENHDNFADQTLSFFMHAHPSSSVGAILQTFALQKALQFGALNLDSNKKNNSTNSFYDGNSDIPSEILRYIDYSLGQLLASPKFSQFPDMKNSLVCYLQKLEKMKQLLSLSWQAERWCVDDVRQKLETSSDALDSVPIALFCFLAAFETIPHMVVADNQFRRTIQLAMGFDKDSNTISAMAGALAGAYLGRKAIHENLYKCCQNYANFVQLAGSLYEIQKNFGPLSTPIGHHKFDEDNVSNSNYDTLVLDAEGFDSHTYPLSFQDFDDYHVSQNDEYAKSAHNFETSFDITLYPFQIEKINFFYDNDDDETHPLTMYNFNDLDDAYR